MSVLEFRHSRVLLLGVFYSRSSVSVLSSKSMKTNFSQQIEISPVQMRPTTADSLNMGSAKGIELHGRFDVKFCHLEAHAVLSSS